MDATKRLTPEIITERMRHLNDNWDPESSHAAEDELMGWILIAIATDHPDPKGLATAFLDNTDPSHTRWYS